MLIDDIKSLHLPQLCHCQEILIYKFAHLDIYSITAYIQMLFETTVLYTRSSKKNISKYRYGQLRNLVFIIFKAQDVIF
jgi:hypothetical protein